MHAMRQKLHVGLAGKIEHMYLEMRCYDSQFEQCPTGDDSI